MKTNSSLAAWVFIILVALGAVLTYALYGFLNESGGIWAGGATLLVALIISNATKVADQWERTVVLRLGSFHALRGPGLFFIIPIVDTIPYWIDIRVIGMPLGIYYLVKNRYRRPQ